MSVLLILIRLTLLLGCAVYCNEVSISVNSRVKRVPLYHPFCHNGTLDTATRIHSGHIFIFADKYHIQFWTDLRAVDVRPKYIKDWTTQFVFNDSINAAFYNDFISNPKFNRTYLIRGTKLVETFNFAINYSLNGANDAVIDIKNWPHFTSHLSKIDLAIYDSSDVVFVSYDKTESESYKIKAVQYNIASINNPKFVTERSTVANSPLLTEPLIDGYMAKAVIPLQTKSTYVVFYKPIVSNKFGIYCITTNLKQKCNKFYNSTKLCFNEIPVTVQPNVPQITSKINSKKTTEDNTKSEMITTAKTKPNGNSHLWLFVIVIILIPFIGGLLVFVAIVLIHPKSQSNKEEKKRKNKITVIKSTKSSKKR